jgi:drug/metabolite transporter (DMT)-like permease
MAMPPPSPAVQAALLMVLANLAVAVMTVGIRAVSAELHPFEIAFFRNAFGLAFMLPFLIHAGLRMARTHAPGRLLLSSVGHLVAMLGYFWAAAHMPLAELTALVFTKPLFATVGAALILHEVVRGRRWSAIAAGFLGVVLVVRPDLGALSPHAAAALLSALASAAGVLMVKQLTRHTPLATIVLYQTLFLTALSLPPALVDWRWPGVEAWLLLAMIGGLGTLTWLCFTRAFALADASAVMPFEFLKLPFTAVLAYLLFAEVPSLWTWVGALVIFGSTFYIARREAGAARPRPVAPTPGSVRPPLPPRP